MSTNIVDTLHGIPPSGFTTAISLDVDIPDWETPSHEQMPQWLALKLAAPPKSEKKKPPHVPPCVAESTLAGTTEHEGKKYLGWPRGITREFMLHHFHDMNGPEVLLYCYLASLFNKKVGFAWPTTSEISHDMPFDRRYLSDVRARLEKRGLVEWWSIWQHDTRTMWRVFRLPHIELDKKGEPLHRAVRQSLAAKELLEMKRKRNLPLGYRWVRDAKLLTNQNNLPDF